MKLAGRCKKCGGAVFMDEDGPKCLNCGEPAWRPNPPPENANGVNHAKVQGVDDSGPRQLIESLDEPAAAQEEEELAEEEHGLARSRQEEDAAAEAALKTKKRPLTRATKCSGCRFYVVHNELPWCTTKKCPSRYPKSLRPARRPPLNIPAARQESSQLSSLALVGMPAWRDDWYPVVQVKWLDVFLKLRQGAQK